MCNSCESLVIHKNIEREILPKLIEVLKKHHVEIRGDEYSKQIIPEIEEAKEEDFYAEYLDYIISIKTVNSIGEAIEHINECSTKHSESIITENYENALLQIYNPAEDSDRLKNQPELFETLRGDYPLRREEQAYIIKYKE